MQLRYGTLVKQWLRISAFETSPTFCLFICSRTDVQRLLCDPCEGLAVDRRHRHGRTFVQRPCQCTCHIMRCTCTRASPIGSAGACSHSVYSYTSNGPTSADTFLSTYAMQTKITAATGLLAIWSVPATPFASRSNPRYPPVKDEAVYGSAIFRNEGRMNWLVVRRQMNQARALMQGACTRRTTHHTRPPVILSVGLSSALLSSRSTEIAAPYIYDHYRRTSQLACA